MRLVQRVQCARRSTCRKSRHPRSNNLYRPLHRNIHIYGDDVGRTGLPGHLHPAPNRRAERGAAARQRRRNLRHCGYHPDEQVTTPSRPLRVPPGGAAQTIARDVPATSPTRLATYPTPAAQASATRRTAPPPRCCTALSASSHRRRTPAGTSLSSSRGAGRAATGRC